MILEEIKEMIIERYDPEYVCEALNISTEDLVNAFEDKIIQYMNAFEDDLEVDIHEFSRYKSEMNDDE